MPGGEGLDGLYLGPVLPEGWERSETANGIPYYLKHGEEATQWDHPEMTHIFKDIDGMNSIRYAAYRTAMKLRVIQKITRLNAVDKHVLEQAFSEMGLSYVHNSGVLSVVETEAVLNKIFQLAQGDRTDFLQPERCTELTLNWVLKCYDSGRTGMVKVRSLKVGLAAMCTASLQDKYRYIFHQATSGHVGLSYFSLRTILSDLLALPHCVSEDGAFSPDGADDAVHSCWDTAGNQPTDILNLEEFLGWLQREPVCLVWLPTLHRLATAETVKHEAKCAACKAFPIVGFRYRCKKCTNVDLCQNCFWTQKTLKNHKITHPTKEYCLATTTGDDVRDFASQMKNKITRKYRRKPPKKGYLDYPVSPARAEDLPDDSPVFANVHTRVNLLAARLHELEGHGEGEEQPHPLPQPLPPVAPPVVVHHHMDKAAPIEQTDGERNAREEELEGRVHELLGEKQQLEAQIQMLSELLAQPPKEPPPMPAPHRTPELEMRSEGVSVSLPVGVSLLGESPWSLSSYTLGGEEKEMEDLLRELLTAFPTQTTEAVACDLGHELFVAATAIGTALSTMVEQVASTQELPS